MIYFLIECNIFIPFYFDGITVTIQAESKLTEHFCNCLLSNQVIYEIVELPFQMSIHWRNTSLDYMFIYNLVP